MMIKFLAHGAGSARRAADYLLGTHDHNGEERAEVRPLLGDMHRVATVADSLSFKWRYSSAVVAWTREDAPTDSDIDAVLADFDRVAFAGMEPDEYSRAAVLHVDDDGARHVHVLIARTDLATGRAYNPAPPGWQKSFDPLRDMYNYANGWARPDDPARRRPVQKAGAELHDLLERGREKDQITDRLMKKVLAGAGTDRIRDRAGVIAALEGLGKITRKGKDYVSVRIEGYAKPLRLKGPIYSEDFDAAMADELILDAEVARQGLRKPDSEPNPEKAESAREAMEAAIKKRAEQFQKSHRRAKPESVPAAAAEAPAPTPTPTPTRARRPIPEVIDDGNRTLIARLAEEFDQRIRRARAAVDRSLRESREALESGIRRARAAIRSAFERFDGALGRYDRASERFDGALGDHDRGLRELAAAGESIRRAADATHRSLQRSNVAFEQGLRRLRERAAAKPAAEDNDLDDVLNPKQKSGTSGPRWGM